MKSIELKKELAKIAPNADNSDLDWIIVEACKISRSYISMNVEISENGVKEAINLAKLRATGMPLVQCFGKACFYGRDFIVNKNCLSPRCETEELVELVLKEIKSGVGLDIGSGSGAIAITLNLENNKINMTSVDVSEGALKVAQENNKKFNARVNFIKSDLFNNVLGKFDFIVSNPPYIKSEDMQKLQPEVKNYEPHLALDGGVDGLDFYRRIVNGAPKHLKPNGKIFFEVGINQAEDVCELLKVEFKDIKVVYDLQNVARIVYATLKDEVK